MAQSGFPQPTPQNPKKSTSCLGKGCFGCLGSLVFLAILGRILDSVVPNPVPSQIETSAFPTNAPRILETPQEKAEKLKAAKALKVQKRKKAEEAAKKAAISQAEIKSKADRALAKLRANYDKIEEVTWYKPKSAPRYANSRSAIYPYFGMSQAATFPLNLHIQYVGDDWVFMESVTIKTDSQSYKIPISFQERKSDNGELPNGEMGVWEWYDGEVTPDQIEMLKDMGDSSDVTMRFNGQQY